eukprot:10488410-Ditylum_brightwellii.AAC.1
MDDGVAMDIDPNYQMIPHNAKVVKIVNEVSPLCINQAMHQLLRERGGISQMSNILGSTMVDQESILIDLQEFSDNKSVYSTSSIHSMDDAMIDQYLSE